MKSILLDVLKENVKEKYDFKSGNILIDVENCINILCEELINIYNVGYSIQNSIDSVDLITEDNSNNLCPICSEKENSNYNTLQNILQTALGELEKINLEKEINIYCIFHILLQSNISEIEYLFNFTSEEIDSLPEETLITVVQEATKRLIKKSLNTEKNIEFFSFIVGFLNEELDKVF